MLKETPPPKSYTLKDLLFMPVGCMLTLSPYLALGGLALAVVVGMIVYYNVNLDFFGIGIVNYAQVTPSVRFDRIFDGDQTWSIAYESYTPSQYNGLVRHISPIRLDQIPLLTHDVLVTSGDFADSKKVSTSVVDHHFSWASQSSTYPQGSINLIHAVPKSEAIYRQLLDVRTGEWVKITGLEIARIDSLDKDGKSIMWWQDNGCNTLLVTSVEIVKQ
jgi:hypothetical protein